MIALEKIPPFPAVLARLNTITADPAASLDIVADVLRTDPGLAARTMAACQSAFYQRAEPPETLRDAVLILGVREVARIGQIFALADFVQGNSTRSKVAMRYYWERSVTAALAMEDLTDGNEVAYTTGLMHLVGIWVIGQSGLLAEEIACRDLAQQATLEQASLGFNFAEVGALALSHWGFAPEIVDAVGQQLDPKPGTLAATLHEAILVTDLSTGRAVPGLEPEQEKRLAEVAYRVSAKRGALLPEGTGAF